MELVFTSLLAFAEGVALIVSPCILPILPLILGGSLSGGKARAFGIIIGFIITFTTATLFSRVILLWLGVDANILRDVALLLLVLIGIIMLSTYLSTKINAVFSRWATLIKLPESQGSFGGGILFGSLLGVLWTPCAGPLLAAVIVQSIAQQTTLASFVITFAFALGVAIPMLLIVLFGRRLVTRFSLMRHYSNAIRRTLGIIIIIGAMALYFQNWFTLIAANIKQASFTSTSSGVVTPYPAPPIEGIDAWINSPPLQLGQLRGKVVLLDFWTYSCINCIRTFPYLKQWYAKYHDKGFIIIGIHSPEFAFEGDVANVVDAVKNYNLLYPIALDNRFVTWQNYRNVYWPSHYLIDKDGRVVYQHFGEGEYVATENQIRRLLGLPPLQQGSDTAKLSLQTPEVYLGFSRAKSFANAETPALKRAFVYHYPQNLPLNSWALQGSWQIETVRIISTAPQARVKIHFIAKNVYAVMGAAQKTVNLIVTLNDRKVVVNNGKDVVDGVCTVSKNRLYHLLQFQETTEGILELKAETAGLELYTFTFG